MPAQGFLAQVSDVYGLGPSGISLSCHPSYQSPPPRNCPRSCSSCRKVSPSLFAEWDALPKTQEIRRLSDPAVQAAKACGPAPAPGPGPGPAPENAVASRYVTRCRKCGCVHGGGTSPDGSARCSACSSPSSAGSGPRFVVASAAEVVYLPARAPRARRHGGGGGRRRSAANSEIRWRRRRCWPRSGRAGSGPRSGRSTGGGRGGPGPCGGAAASARPAVAPGAASRREQPGDVGLRLGLRLGQVGRPAVRGAGPGVGSGSGRARGAGARSSPPPVDRARGLSIAVRAPRPRSLGVLCTPYRFQLEYRKCVDIGLFRDQSCGVSLVVIAYSLGQSRLFPIQFSVCACLWSQINGASGEGFYVFTSWVPAVLFVEALGEELLMKLAKYCYFTVTAGFRRFYEPPTPSLAVYFKYESFVEGGDFGVTLLHHAAHRLQVFDWVLCDAVNKIDTTPALHSAERDEK